MTIGRWILWTFVMVGWLGGGQFGKAELPFGAPVTLLEMPLRYEDWPSQRSADAVLELDPVRAVLSVFSEEMGHKVIVRHPGGDSGDVWVLEFQEWLVAFGVPLHCITLEPGSGGTDRLLILVEVTLVALDSSA